MAIGKGKDDNHDILLNINSACKHELNSICKTLPQDTPPPQSISNNRLDSSFAGNHSCLFTPTSVAVGVALVSGTAATVIATLAMTSVLTLPPIAMVGVLVGALALTVVVSLTYAAIKERCNKSIIDESSPLIDSNDTGLIQI